MFQPLKLTAALALRVERTSGRQRAERTGDTGGGKAATKTNLEFSSNNLRAERTQRTTRRGGQLGNDDWDNIFMRLYFGRVKGMHLLDFMLHLYFRHLILAMSKCIPTKLLKHKEENKKRL